MCHFQLSEETSLNPFHNISLIQCDTRRNISIRTSTKQIMNSEQNSLELSVKVFAGDIWLWKMHPNKMVAGAVCANRRGA